MSNTAVYNMCINQGATYAVTFTWDQGPCSCSTVGAAPEPVDLTDYTVAMQIRQFVLAPTILYDASDNITLGGTAGTISLNIPSAATINFTWFAGVYDIVLTDPYGTATRLISGNVTIDSAVTQVSNWTADSAGATADSASYSADGS